MIERTIPGSGETEWQSNARLELTTEKEAKSEPTAEDFEAQADYIAMEIASHERAHDGFKSAHEAYVEDEPNAELKKFGKLLLLAPMAARMQGKMDALTKDDPEYDKNRRAFCAYNQLLVSFIERNEAAITRDKLESWLDRASGNNRLWARRVVAGVAAEVAAYKLLAEVPGIVDLQHGDLDQDLAGKDLVFAPTPSRDSSIDVKTGEHRPNMPVTRDERSNKLLLSIDPVHINDFEIKDEQVKQVYIKLLIKSLDIGGRR